MGLVANVILVTVLGKKNVIPHFRLTLGDSGLGWAILADFELRLFNSDYVLFSQSPCQIYFALFSSHSRKTWCGRVLFVEGSSFIISCECEPTFVFAKTRKNLRPADTAVTDSNQSVKSNLRAFFGNC